MKIKTKNAKNGVTSTVHLALHKDLILTLKKEVQWSQIDQNDGSQKVTYGETL